jgi:hypothetical protein
LHDAHNALKWSFHAHFNDLELMKDIYIVVASVINSSDLVCKHLAPWLLAHLEVAPNGDLPPAQDCSRGRA